MAALVGNFSAHDNVGHIQNVFLPWQPFGWYLQTPILNDKHLCYEKKKRSDTTNLLHCAFDDVYRLQHDSILQCKPQNTHTWHMYQACRLPCFFPINSNCLPPFSTGLPNWIATWMGDTHALFANFSVNYICLLDVQITPAYWTSVTAA